MNLPVAILAGGLATRMGSITQKMPKALLDIAGRPFAERQLDLLKSHGIARAVFCVGHFGEQIESALGDGGRLGMHLAYSYDGPQLLGTGGALRRALPLLGEAFLVLYGDSYLDCPYERIERALGTSGKPALMTVCHNENRWDKSNILFQDGRIILYDKKNRTPEMQHIDYGLGAFRAEALAGYPDDCNFDLERVYRDLLAKDLLAGFEVSERFYEIGSAAGLEELRNYFSGRGYAQIQPGLPKPAPQDQGV
jgi:N-acetyl-alpha-D-muramate 1-phosphate uridylyltransferase